MAVNPFTEVPLPTTAQPLRVQKTSLDGTPFTLRFDWNSRTERWSFSLYLDDGTPLLLGGVLVAGVDLLRTVSDDLRPGGQLMIVDFTEPTLDTIGNVSLIYLNAAYV